MFARRRCRKISRLLWDHQASALLAPDRQDVEAHLQQCRSCREQAEAYRRTAHWVDVDREQPLPVFPSARVELRRQLQMMSSRSDRARLIDRRPQSWAAGALAFALLVGISFAWRAVRGGVPSKRATPRGEHAATAPAPRRDEPLPAAGSAPNPKRAMAVRPPDRDFTSAGSPPPGRRLLPRLSVPGTSPRSGGDDLHYVNADPASVLAGWARIQPDSAVALKARLDRIARSGDDFISVPIPRVAAADERSLAAAVDAYQREKAIMDPRLAAKVSLAVKAMEFSDLCQRLQEKTGIRMTAGAAVAADKVTLFCDECPLRDVMRQVSHVFGFNWLRSGDEGSYRYELTQDLKAQLAEEELRTRDVHQALLALDEQMALYRPYLDQSVDALMARHERAEGEEQQRLWNLVKGGGWGPAKLYFRLSPAERTALMSGERLEYRLEDSNPDSRLPPEWRKELLKSSGLSLFPGGTIIQAAIAADKPSTPVDQVPNAEPEVYLELDRSEAGVFTLMVRTGALLKVDGTITSAGGFTWKMATGRSPSTASPDNSAANESLRPDASLKRVIDLQPRSSCPRLAEEATRARRRAVEQLYSFDREFQEPHVTTADVWEEIHRQTGLNVVADSYTHLFPVSVATIRQSSTFDALCRVGDALGFQWKKDAAFLQGRSTAYFWDRLKEVPNRLLVRWKQESGRQNGLPLADLVEMAGLSECQLGSTTVGKGIVHCWGLDEWGIIGGGPFIAGEILAREMRKRARTLAPLTAEQLRLVQQPKGLALTDLTPAQRDVVLKQFGWAASELAPEQLRFHVDYLPSGRYVWEPLVTREKYEAAAKRWPLIAADTAEEVLAAARRIDPEARVGEIHPTRGRLAFSFLKPNGEQWWLDSGPVRVLAPLE